MVGGLKLGQRVSNEQRSVGQTQYVAVRRKRLGFGWRMVSVLAGKGGLKMVTILN